MGACLENRCTVSLGTDTSTAIAPNDRIHELWQAAQEDIWQSWMIETDPANLQPAVRPLNRRVAQLIRDNLPPDFDADRVRRALDIAESPWPRREELMLREWFNREYGSPVDGARHLIEQILRTGIEPFKEPPTLPPITSDEIELVCWMAISPNASV